MEFSITVGALNLRGARRRLRIDWAYAKTHHHRQLFGRCATSAVIDEPPIGIKRQVKQDNPEAQKIKAPLAGCHRNVGGVVTTVKSYKKEKNANAQGHVSQEAGH